MISDLKELLLGILFWGTIIILSIFVEKHNKKMEELQKIPYKSRYTRKERIRNIKIKKFEKYIWKIAKIILKAVFIILGLIIVFILLAWLFEWIKSNPLWVIIILLVMILLKNN